MNPPTTTEDRGVELVWIAPSDAIIDSNVRTLIEPNALAELANSIAERGILQPPRGWRDEDGLVHIGIGQRRVLAAVEAGASEIPVLIMSRLDVEQERYLDQLVENERRQPLTTGERLAAYEQLTLFGVKADEIAKRTGTRRDQVRNAVKIAKEAPIAAEIATEKQLSFDAALVLAEFEDDEPERQELVDVIDQLDPKELTRRVAELRAQRSRRQQLEAFRAQAESAGIPWVDPTAVGDYFSPYVKLGRLRIGKAEVAPTVEEAKAQGGLVASAGWEWGDVDGVRTRIYELEYFIENPKEHGYREPRASSAAPLSYAEKKKRANERAKKKARVEAWGDATESRQTWIRDQLLTALVVPADAQLWILKTLIAQRDVVGASTSSHLEGKARDLALTWLGEEPEAESNWWARRPTFMRIATARPGAELLVALAYVVALSEIAISDRKAYNYGEHKEAGAYLRQLASWGHSLAEIEQKLVERWESEMSTDEEV